MQESTQITRLVGAVDGTNVDRLTAEIEKATDQIVALKLELNEPSDTESFSIFDEDDLVISTSEYEILIPKSGYSSLLDRLSMGNDCFFVESMVNSRFG
jgi:hypothetical protein